MPPERVRATSGPDRRNFSRVSREVPPLLRFVVRLSASSLVERPGTRPLFIERPTDKMPMLCAVEGGQFGGTPLHFSDDLTRRICESVEMRVDR